MAPVASSYEEEQISAITEWVNRSPDVISRVADSVLSPFTRAVSMIIPEKAMIGALDLGNAAGAGLSRLQTIKKFACISEYSELRSRKLEFCDQIAQGEQNWAMGVAAAEGGATGAMGLPGLTIDIPAIIAQAMRAIHLMGLCYGYELRTKQDQEIAMAILSASGANSMKEKVAALVYLRTIQTTLAQTTFKRMAERAAQSAFSQPAVILAAKALAKQLGVNLTKRKMAQSIPIIGAGIGATVNAWYIRDVCWAARRMFQERWLTENGLLDRPLGQLPEPVNCSEAELIEPS